jgi:RNA-directed DNA polymerase
MGVPQGGPISPTIFNYVLNGIDAEVKKIKYCTPVRFADDILVLARTNEQLLNALENIKKFIEPRGLSINDQKTVITTIETGFDYLGYNIREYKDDSRTGKKGFGLKQGIVICKPSKKSVARFKLDIREIIIKNVHTSAGMLIMKLNPLISG